MRIDSRWVFMLAREGHSGEEQAFEISGGRGLVFSTVG